MTLRRICLVTPSHLSCNPRLVKEADALHAAGCDVHVVSARYFPGVDAADREILQHAPWTHRQVELGRGFRVMWRKFAQRLARAAAARAQALTPAVAARAHHAGVDALAAAAANLRADLYIGHTLAGLSAAAQAAQITGARYGFDAEDFHSGETHAALEDRVLAKTIRTIESALLPHCAHMTAASPQIAQAYQETYSLPRPPAVVLNVFPRTQAPAQPVIPAFAPERPARLYWFSQTIGPERGLELLVAALGRTTTPSSLHLRGFPAPGFERTLRTLAAESGFRGQLEFLPFSPAAEMVRLAAAYDLGLSLERPTPPNRNLCLTNKIFTFLLAGIPVALTPTLAQRSLAHELGRAALPLDLTDPATAARTLDRWLADIDVRRAAHAVAWNLGQQRYNWETEQSNMLTAITAGFADAR